MPKYLFAALLACTVASDLPANVTRAQVSLFIDCLHNGTETASNKTRREQAITLARAINDGQARIAERTRNYAPLALLGNLPPTPAGFELRFYFDGANYAFSLKDRRDICRYAVFSDQDGWLYEKTPKEALIAGASTAARR